MRNATFLRVVLAAAAVILGSFVLQTPLRAQIIFSTFVDPQPVVSSGTIGFTFAGTGFVGSADGDGLGILYSTDLNGGNVKLFAPGVRIPASPRGFGEHALATSLGEGGFPLWDIYVAAGAGVLHITNDGTSSNMLVGGLASEVRGLLFDGVGTFGHDLLVSTIDGEIYRVKSSGAVALLASQPGEDMEGMDIVPLGADFGSYDGDLVTASENSGLLRAITPSGAVTVLNSNNPIPRPETLRFVPLNLGATGSRLEGLYSANYPSNVLKASAGQFMSFKGDAIVMTETGDQRISRVHWSGSAFQITIIGASSAEAEQAFFLGPDLLNPCVCTDPKAIKAHDNHALYAPSCSNQGRRLP